MPVSKGSACCSIAIPHYRHAADSAPRLGAWCWGLGRLGGLAPLALAREVGAACGREPFVARFGAGPAQGDEIGSQKSFESAVGGLDGRSGERLRPSGSLLIGQLSVGEGVPRAGRAERTASLAAKRKYLAERSKSEGRGPATKRHDNDFAQIPFRGSMHPAGRNNRGHRDPLLLPPSLRR